jgi:hypothetical protein
MENVIVDLTKRSDGKLNGVSLKSIKVQEVASTLPSYLQEVNLGANMRAAYFTEGVPADKDFFYYNLIWMKIPTGFNYVKYSRDETSGDILIEGTIPTEADIIAPILVLFEKDDVDDLLHICDTYDLGPGGQNGCSILVGSYAQTAAIKAKTSSVNANTPEKPFYLFNYNGELRMASVDKKGKIVIEEKKGNYYLFPLMLSDKTVVFYAINGDDPDVLKILYDDATLPRKKYVDVDFPLTMNDALGVFVTSQVKWAFPT